MSTSDEPPPNFQARHWVTLFVILTIIGVPIGLWLIAQARSDALAKRLQCICNLRDIGLAFHQYHDTYHILPTEGESGSPSFYKALLPYTDAEGVEDGHPLRMFLCPTRRTPQVGAKRDYGYAASNGAGSEGHSLLDAPRGLSLGKRFIMRSPDSILLLSHVWMATQHYRSGDPTDLGWATRNNSRSVNTTAIADRDVSGSIAHIGGPHPGYVPSLWLDAHVSNLPFDYPYWAQAWAYDSEGPPRSSLP